MNRDTNPAGASALPASLQPLNDLAYNLRWTWDEPTRRIFAYAAGTALAGATPNPVEVLRRLTPERVAELASDAGFLDQLNAAAGALERARAATGTWFDTLAYTGASPVTAYFSAEFGLSEHLPIYSGGLGVLAGDHLKSASALGLPLVAVGLFYYDGYFRQAIDRAGWQADADAASDPNELPLKRVCDGAGQPVTISVDILERTVTAQVWQATVGRIPLYLMDTRLAENAPEDQAICARLYGGDQDLRLRQEIMLGIGGLRVLNALDIQPAIFHLNEGHSSFLALERIRERMHADGACFTDALAVINDSTIFTTHTPVAAGHDYFPPGLLEPYFRDFATELGLDWQDFLSLGRVDGNDPEAAFGMTELAMRSASARNGVSKLHGAVTRRMWHKLWPHGGVDDVPIGHVTNGVHMATWIAPDIAALCDAHVTADWRHSPTSFDDWKALEHIPDETLWQTHQKQKARVMATARERLRRQLMRHGGPEAEAARALDPDALTIGFARRFTAYKRATLLLRDLDRLAALVAASDRPVQFIFAGKAHPRDTPGKQLIQRIATIAQRQPFNGRILFLEDYDMALARDMVAGVDVWLNNPIRPQEASGTSGMKAAANGVLNFSVLDGWWAEAWETARERDEPIGWSIDSGNACKDDDARDAADAVRLYEVLEQELVPTYYERNAEGLPVAWIERMRASMRCAIPDFGGVRMVAEYTRNYYLPAAARSGLTS